MSARNLAQGHGLTTDVLWSYASPPVTLPRPAFDLWLPLASLVAAVPMLVAGTGHLAGQAGGVALGALMAPLTWAVAGEAARLNGLDQRRSTSLSITAGLLAAVLGPWLVATAAPDSTVPFTVLATIAALLMSRMLLGVTRPGWRSGLFLGIVLGLTYLARQEVAWLGLVFLALCVRPLRAAPPGTRLRASMALLGPVVVGGLVVVVPWLVRQQVTFAGSAMTQALENMFLLRNEQIFSIHDRPTFAGWLGQGVGDILAAPLRAMGNQLTDVLLVGAFPIGAVGIVSAGLMRRSPALRRPSALVVLLLSGTLTFLATAILFPVATLWGTFLHASGPLLVGLIVASVLGVDAGMARVSARRGWPKVNIIVGPVALLALAMPVAAVQLASVANSASTMERRIAAVRIALGLLDDDHTAPLMSDHPMSLAWVLDRPVMVLPDDPPGTLGELARDTGVRTLIVFDDRGRYPGTPDRPDRSDLPRDRAEADRPGRRPGLAVSSRPGMRGTMTGEGGAGRTSPYTRLTMETGIRGDRRADVDALYAEAQQALTQSANRLRTLTERLREVHAAELAEAHRQPEAGSPSTQDAERDQQAMDAARAGQLLSRLELITRDLEDGWRFLERGQGGEWSGTGRANPDQLQIERPANLVEARMVLEAQEQERTRLAEELHDGPAQTLSNAVFRVRIVERALRSDPALADGELAALGTMLERETERLRDFIRQLRPALQEAGDLAFGAHRCHQSAACGDGHRGGDRPHRTRGAARRARPDGGAARRPRGISERAEALWCRACPTHHPTGGRCRAIRPDVVGPGGPG